MSQSRESLIALLNQLKEELRQKEDSYNERVKPYVDTKNHLQRLEIESPHNEIEIKQALANLSLFKAVVEDEKTSQLFVEIDDLIEKILLLEKEMGIEVESQNSPSILEKFKV